MPTITLERLVTDPAVLRAVQDLRSQEPGLILTSGQSATGKSTVLIAIALVLARPQQDVLLFVVGSELDVFHPLPPGWAMRRVESSAAGWAQALREAPPDALLVASEATQDNATALWQAAAGRWVLAPVDTPLIAQDVAYALFGMGLGYDAFLERVRLVWAQTLLESICPTCARPAVLSRADRDYLFPGSWRPRSLQAEAGCDACNGTGRKGRVAAADVLLIGQANREQVRRAIEQGAGLPADPAWHFPLQAQAQRLLEEGRIGIGTYRDAIRRNPLLRAQNAIEREQAHSGRLGEMFDKFVSPEVKRRLLDTHTLHKVVSGEAREITCMFVDMRGFTPRAESRDPQTLFEELNRYFSEVVDCVLATDGTIDKFIGDAVMAVWGAPTDQPDHARRGVACALAIRSRVDAFNEAHSSDLPIEIGIGLNSGRAMAGCIGTDARMEYTVLGDTVNIAARLESRALAGQILASRATMEAAGAGFGFGPAQPLSLKGKAATVDAFEVER
jgi:class 3 adenylate cyclase